MISRIRIEAYGEMAGDVETQLLEFEERCDLMTEARACAPGELVIERQLTEPLGSPLAFKGRYTLHSDIGTTPFVRAEVLSEAHPA